MSIPQAILIHDWLYTYVGSERVVEAILHCMPVEKIYTIVDFLPGEQRSFLKETPVKTSFIQKLPWARSLRRFYLPLMPLAIEGFDVSSADLIISSSSAVAKGILTNAEQLHICYCHTPARYAWDLTHMYLREGGWGKALKAGLARMTFHYIRLWDLASANRVDHFIANSLYVARRIWHTYRRESTVIYPPVNVDDLEFASQKEDFYLTVSRLEIYKRVDLIVETFAKLKKKLVVIGEGPEMARIKAKAAPNIEILGYQPREVVKEMMKRARAFVFAAEEDFGMVPVEAQASGTPVIVYGRGGALETVHGVFPGLTPAPETTGVFFRRQTADSLKEAVEWFERHREEIDPRACQKNAERFSHQRFEQEFKEFVEAKWADFEAARNRRYGSG
jgi:glycosyltransferase involved in cell wall biosynthesis